MIQYTITSVRRSHIAASRLSQYHSARAMLKGDSAKAAPDHICASQNNGMILAEEVKHCDTAAGKWTP
jgi:hypothetical protein